MQQSIKRTLNVQVGAVIFIVNILIGVIFYSFSAHISEKDFLKRIEVQKQYLYNVYSQLLWHFDINSIEVLSDMALTNSDLLGLRLVSSDNEVIIEKGVLSPESPIFYKQKLHHQHQSFIGYVELAFAKSSIKRQQDLIIAVCFLMVLGTIITSLLFITSLLNRHLVAPLKLLQQDLGSITDGNFKPSKILGQKSEIQNIINGFNKMSAALAERDRTIYQTQERYREIVEGTKNLVAEVGPDGKFLFVNDVSLEIFGLPPNECIGQTAIDFVHPDDVERTKKTISEWVETNQTNITFENRLVSVTGQVRDILWSIIIYYDENNDVSSVKSIGRDITSRKEIEKELNSSLKKFEKAFRAAPVWVVLSLLEGGQYLEVNDTFLSSMGYPQKDVIGKTSVELNSWADEFDRERIVSQLREKGRVRNVPVDRRTRDGKILNTLFSAEIVQLESKPVIISVTQDVTELKQIERALQASQKRLELAFEGANDGLWDWSPQTNEIYFSPRWFTMLGYDADEFAHDFDTWIKLTHPKDLKKTMVIVEKFLADQDDFYAATFRMKNKDGQWKWINARGKAVERDEKGNITRMVGTHSDISELKKVEEELRNHKEHLEELVENRTSELMIAKEEADKANRAKSEFLANMSHEIRTPLNAVTGFSELLSSMVTDEKQKSYLEAIKSSGKSLLQLINDILDLSKIEAGKLDIQKRPVNLKILLNEIRQIFKLEVDKKKIGFKVEIDDALPGLVLLDEIRVRQVLVNLIGNAVKFTEQGHIKLSVKKGQTSERADYFDLIIWVEDTGLGISEGNMDLIFDSFKQQKDQDVSKFGGTGLGLTICKRLVEMMDGRIGVESKLDEGTKFIIEIKDAQAVYTDDEEPILEASGISHEEVVFKKGKVLIVDDIGSNKRLLEELLVKVNIDVLTADNGKESITVSKAFMPDVVLMDIRMPVMNGIEATGIIKNNKETQNIPIIAVTASSSTLEESDLLNKGFDGFLSKPIKIEELLYELSNYLELTTNDECELTIDEIEKLKHDENLTSDQVANLTKAIEIIEMNMMDTWREFQETQPIKEVRTFGKEIEALGSTYDVPLLSTYGRCLLLYARTFDVKNMQLSIKEFPRLIEKLKLKRGKIG
ncbi:MAG: PAS domain S-box protein [Desulfobacterales bacterium]|nr:PAS domain S-box protein [Desulfobacterales bacterium]